MKLAVCDDEPLFLNHFLTLCQSFSCIDEMIPFQNGDLLLAQVSAGASFDAVFMDIDFGSKKNGIEYSKSLYEINPQIRLIYTTGFTDRFVQHVFLSPSNMIGFLTKPVNKDILASLLQKLQTSLDEDRQTLFCVVGKSDSISVPINSIFYLESNAHKTLIYTDTENLSIYERLAALKERLPSCFLVCHKSYIVNMNKIKRIEKNVIILENLVEIPISKSQHAKVKQTYFHYMQKDEKKPEDLQ